MKKTHKTTPSVKTGFSIVEVMLVLGIMGLMLVGLIVGTFSAIGRQRYNDAIRNLTEYLSRFYSEALSPVSLGKGNSRTQAVLGKAIVFGSQSDSTIYSATIVGTADISRSITTDFITELSNVDTEVALFCGNAGQPSTVDSYTTLWQTELMRTVPNEANKFQGTLIISRTPTSAVIHTAFTPNIYNLKDQCTPSDSHASDSFRYDLQNNPSDYSITDDVRFCIKSEDSVTVREIDIKANGSNTSAVQLVAEDASVCRQ